MGAGRIFATDLVESRLEWARKFGANAAFNVATKNVQDSILGLTDGKGVDKVIVSSASGKAIESSLQLVRKGGKILLFGIPPEGTYVNLDTSYIFIREISLIPSYSTTEAEIEAALQMMASKKIHMSEMITHRFELAYIADAFRTAEDAASSLKVMVHG
jgi:L-iditol 2-dehydrogenase